MYNSYVGGCLIFSILCLTESALNTFDIMHRLQMNTHMQKIPIKDIQSLYGESDSVCDASEKQR